MTHPLLLQRLARVSNNVGEPPPAAVTWVSSFPRNGGTMADLAQAQARLQELVDEARSDPRPTHMDVVEQSRVRLCNILTGESIADLGTDALGQGPTLLAALIVCRGVFEGTATLYEVLTTNALSAPAWTGRRKNLRPVYARLQRALADTIVPLAYEGFYGFYRRASDDQKREMDARRQQRSERARRARRLARRQGV